MLVHIEIVNIHAAGWHSVRITSTAAGGLIAKGDILLVRRRRRSYHVLVPLKATE